MSASEAEAGAGADGAIAVGIEVTAPLATSTVEIGWVDACDAEAL
jgi:hypothetical protein